MTPTPKIWHNGQFIAWNDAKIHVLSHVVSYGSSVFEGIRVYETANGPAVFRLREHIRRMFYECCEVSTDPRGHVLDCTPRSLEAVPPDCRAAAVAWACRRGS